MIRLRPSGADEVLIKRIRDWYEPGPGVFFTGIAGTASFSPAMLFTGSTTGFWYDPSDLNTLFQDAAGTTPVTAVEQPVGLMLDKSSRGNHALNPSGNSANFPVLSARYNLYVNTETLSTQNVTTVATSYKLTFTGSGSITLTGTATGVYTAGSYTISCAAGTLTSTVLGTVTQADLRISNDALNQPAYQRVNTATDYDTVGFKPYLRFNGTNQWLQTNSIDFSYGDKMFVCAGVRHLSNANYGGLVGLGATVGTAGSFLLWTRSAAGTGGFEWYSNGNATGTITESATPTLPRTSVVSTTGDISLTGAANELKLRINGSLATTTAAGDCGTGNYANAVITIGSYNASNFFNGRLYQLIVAGKFASASEIGQTEAFTNQKTGAY